MKYLLAFAVSIGLLASTAGAFAGPQSDLRLHDASRPQASSQAEAYQLAEYHHYHHHHHSYHHHPHRYHHDHH